MAILFNLNNKMTSVNHLLISLFRLQPSAASLLLSRCSKKKTGNGAKLELLRPEGFVARTHTS